VRDFVLTAAASNAVLLITSYMIREVFIAKYLFQFDDVCTRR